MTTFYNHNKIEKKWQTSWASSDLYQAKEGGDKKYILDMFSYPSGAGLHVGHPESYTATDIVARYFRFKGFNVLHPVGFDAFGLPAENYAIKQGVRPQETTQKNIEIFRRQIKSLGFSYDWSREVDTSSPEYYKWTQWLFLKLYEKGLAYKKAAPVNWCDSCKTVLANEQVTDSKCERCENQVIQKNLEQWFLKVTEYAEELLQQMEDLDWPEALKSAQRNWIGRSEGALLDFELKGLDKSVEVFTTRPDTLFGSTYLVLAPEHSLVSELKNQISNWPAVAEYIKQAQNKNQLERTDLNKDKTGVKLEGVMAVNPGSHEEIPVYIADYVMTNYGTGAIMAVPAHDERDWEFAISRNIPIKYVIEPDTVKDVRGNYFQEIIYKIEEGQSYEDAENQALKYIFQQIKDCVGYGYNGNGKLINSDKFDGLNSEEAKEKITKDVKGKKKVNYKIRDWLISRQRYWGAPIPIIYCDKCGQVPVPEKDLPVLLPNDVDFKPTGESPLKSSKSFHEVKCPKCGGQAKRESDTMDTFVCSSWYFLRYCDSSNNQEAFSKKAVNYWMPVDLYIGGMEHAVGHLIYSRFITKALRDAGYLKFDEPFLKIRAQGIILAEDGRKMSKRWGNVINPDQVAEEYGADSLRLYEMFMGPLEDMKPWNTKGIIGVRRFLEKVYKFSLEIKDNFNEDSATERLLHKTVKKVTEDIEGIKFNTAISAMMVFINQVASSKKISGQELEKFLIILSPFAPHLAEELWSELGHNESIFREKWPDYDSKLIIDEEITMAVQINGKLRATIAVQRGIKEKELRDRVEALANVQKNLEGRQIKKFIYIEDKLVNLVV